MAPDSESTICAKQLLLEFFLGLLLHDKVLRLHQNCLRSDGSVVGVDQLLLVLKGLTWSYYCVILYLLSKACRALPLGGIKLLLQ